MKKGNKVYPWEKLMKKGDTFVTDKPVSKHTQSYFANHCRENLGFTVVTKRFPDGTVQVWRNETLKRGE